MSYPKSHYGHCRNCGKFALLSTHHKFSQTKWAKKLYGDLIDDPRNLVVDICHKCHDHTEKWSEKTFCDTLGIGYKSKELRSKN